jgi:NAD-dependent SIR2 family protein deacetylase
VPAYQRDRDSQTTVGTQAAGETASNEVFDMEPDTLSSFIKAHPRLTVLSGAGVSTDSGIPDYRDDEGNWKHSQPVQFADFVSNEATRKRYWARSFAGWTRVHKARPNAAHLALARLEEARHVDCLVTQNVDNLHREAGSRNVVDLHGVLNKVRCLDCQSVVGRHEVQDQIRGLNPRWRAEVARVRPDGDVLLKKSDLADFRSPACTGCGGLLKPDVVFFGEAVPRQRVGMVLDSISRTDALLVVGSSLMVWSGFRFARKVVAAGKALAIVNRGKTRADDLATLRIRGDCATVLNRVVERL